VSLGFCGEIKDAPEPTLLVSVNASFASIGALLEIDLRKGIDRKKSIPAMQRKRMSSIMEYP
jgi:hypothetical protein